MSTTPTDDQREGLSPPQFRLRTLMVVIGLLCVLLALFRVVTTPTIALVVLLLIAVAIHVAGNAIGTRLRENGSQSLPPTLEAARQRPLTAAHFAPPSRLSRRNPPGWIVVAVIIVGVIVGALSGGYLLSWAIVEKATLANMALGTTAFGVIGGFAGFLMSTFLKVLISANVEAWRGENPKHVIRQPKDS